MAKTFILLFVFLVSLTKAQPRNVTRGSILYTNSTPNFWPTYSGLFAFGFYPSGNGFRVGIWLSGNPKITVVWTAQRNDPPVLPGAALIFSSDGRLLLRSSTGEVNIAVTGDQRALVASIYNSGNLVLYDSSSEIIWESFDHPTNTLLVKQVLARYNYLYSSKSDTDDSVGNFKLAMQGDGNLVAYPMRSLQEGKYAYWSSFTTRPGNNVSLSLDVDGRLYLKNLTGFPIKNLTEGGLLVNDANILYRATFDIDGILRLYQHHLGINGSFNSTKLWSAITEDERCSVKGTCGPNSYCAINGRDIACLCPPEFDFLDPNQPSKGCKLSSSAGSGCFADADRANGNFSISVLDNTAWEREEYDVLTAVSEEGCQEGCLEDCYCEVAMFWDQMCFKMKLPLHFGRENSKSVRKSFVKIRNGSLPVDPQPDTILITKKSGKELVIAGMVLIAFSLIVFVSSGFVICAHKIWRYKINTGQACHDQSIAEDINLRSFSYDQLVAATDDFRDEIGKGASGKVYKGSLGENGGGKEIAVKRLEKMVEDGEREFRNEMKIIGRTHHKNLVHLIGFCSEGSNRLLVYEFMKNGSLENLLFNTQNRPSWKERMRIVLDIAKGLHYLHEECETKIIHCDIKPHNVLMDESHSAKISDFGLSKLLKPDQTRTYTIPRGTRGYGAPEWHKNNTPITTKADVYSFGILLLETICCRKNFDLTAPSEAIILMDWVYRCYEDGELGNVVGDQAELDLGELEKMVKIGLWCVQTEVNSRPTMKEVILMMEGTIVTASPPPVSSINA
ncbi:serine-threonine protein kinase, plant-type, putative [Ricinus communis]|uniref:Receptor-like serine/threonine-protein kinase n=1 Tax=Ricinus communis TaxID=3988 RepID=B9T590_RICCO|nr:serine-threonine protein kinase, plant-type, putative [Ricinus communis]|eukprot:XP_002533409.1 G-type lectin S-receptor-like serine/threonine-protein kinase LECRK4 [Ricinus communis]